MHEELWQSTLRVISGATPLESNFPTQQDLRVPVAYWRQGKCAAVLYVYRTKDGELAHDTVLARIVTGEWIDEYQSSSLLPAVRFRDLPTTPEQVLYFFAWPEAILLCIDEDDEEEGEMPARSLTLFSGFAADEASYLHIQTPADTFDHPINRPLGLVVFGVFNDEPTYITLLDHHRQPLAPAWLVR